eukprot:753127-Hanusia_phi.AAC.1
MAMVEEVGVGGEEEEGGVEFLTRLQDSKKHARMDCVQRDLESLSRDIATLSEEQWEMSHHMLEDYNNLCAGMRFTSISDNIPCQKERAR